jgi:hypothetical protein
VVKAGGADCVGLFRCLQHGRRLAQWLVDIFDHGPNLWQEMMAVSAAKGQSCTFAAEQPSSARPGNPHARLSKDSNSRPMLKTTKKADESAPACHRLLVVSLYLLPECLFIVPIAWSASRSCPRAPRSLCPDIALGGGALGPRTLLAFLGGFLLGDVHGDRRAIAVSTMVSNHIVMRSRFASCTRGGR